MSLISKKLEISSLSPVTQELVLASWRPSTLKQYKPYLCRWETYCSENSIQPLQPKVEHIADFLARLFHSGLGYSAINTARSALSSIITLSPGVQAGNHPLISRLMRGIFQLRPALPKYTTIWDVGQLLEYLKSLPLRADLPLKDLSYKTATLLSILTGQRCQTLHKIDVNFIQVLPEMIHITIPETLKTTRPGNHQAPLQLLSYPDNKNLCVVTHLTEYLERTAPLRNEHTELFISFQRPYLPVSKDTIARWVKSTLKSAGINTNIFSAHSCRAASTSAAKAAGLNLKDIMRSAGWTNAQTFARFYSLNVSKDNFGQSVMSHCN